jgi:hypothetical protein
VAEFGFDVAPAHLRGAVILAEGKQFEFAAERRRPVDRGMRTGGRSRRMSKN